MGGLLESLSLWFGLKSLTILAGILYIASAIFVHREKLAEPAEVAAPAAAEVSS